MKEFNTEAVRIETASALATVWWSSESLLPCSHGN